MKRILHITSGDIAGENLKKSGISGEVFVWHDILYDGPRKPGWPDEDTLPARSIYLEEATGGGLGRQYILETLIAQYLKLEKAKDYDEVILWFDACLFDQSMLAHILACMKIKSFNSAELVCVNAFPGIVPFDGLGQLLPDQMASVFDQRLRLTMDHFHFAERVDCAFALQDKNAFVALSNSLDAPLPWIPVAVARWLQEQPDKATELGRLEQLALEAISTGSATPAEIFKFAADKDTHPLFWSDITLWARINKLATRRPPMVRLEGPGPLLPQWNDKETLEAFRIHPA